MRFVLTDNIVKEIVFAMENQNDDIVLDVKEGKVFAIGNESNCIAVEAVFDEERYIPIPIWDSSDGYALMDEFVSSIKNPIVRTELHSTLLKGRGVFKAFKWVLSLYPEIEKRWFSYKEARLKNRVYSWYDDLREAWGLERLNLENEEVENLLAFDFQIRKYSKSDRQRIEELLESSLKKNFYDHQPYIYKYFLAQIIDTTPDFDDNDSLILTAQATDENIVAFLWAFRITDFNETGIIIRWIAVVDDYLDSGFENELLTQIIKDYKKETTFFILDIPGVEEFRLDTLCGDEWKSIGSIRYFGIE
jgi:hypothetical protein